MNEPIVTLRIELIGVEPTPWREVDVPMSSTLLMTHKIIQAAMGWQDCHMFEFRVGEKSYGVPDPDYDHSGNPNRLFNAKGLTLRMLSDRSISEFFYTYDFGDNWRHQLHITNPREGDPAVDYPRLVQGAGACPPEDVGGVIGYSDFIEAMDSPRHPSHCEVIDWYGSRFDPEKIDWTSIEIRMDMIASKRRGPLMSHRTGKRPWNN